MADDIQNDSLTAIMLCAAGVFLVLFYLVPLVIE